MKELKYYGIHACLSIWKKRPNDIIRVYLDQSNLNTFKAVLKWCAQHKRAYHIVSSSDIDKISASVHHEGVCILAKELSVLSFEDMFIEEKNMCLLYLDGVQNPHNLGSIMRSCAHFGIPFILGKKGELPALSPSACRIAQGAAEIVRLVLLQNLAKSINMLKTKGFSLIAASPHKGKSLHAFTFPSKTILAIGSETHGLQKALLENAEQQVLIPGTGHIESLNVSIAAGICLSEYWREHAQRKNYV